MDEIMMARSNQENIQMWYVSYLLRLDIFYFRKKILKLKRRNSAGTHEFQGTYSRYLRIPVLEYCGLHLGNSSLCMMTCYSR